MEFKHTNNHFETSVSVYLHAPSKIKAIYADKVFAEKSITYCFSFLWQNQAENVSFTVFKKLNDWFLSSLTTISWQFSNPNLENITRVCKIPHRLDII